MSSRADPHPEGRAVQPAGLPEPLISCEALLASLDDPRMTIVEVDEQPLLYRMRHIPGAAMLDWHADLQDQLTRDVPGPEAIWALWARLGISAEQTVVLYGDKYNLYACYAYWVFWLYGLRNMRILDGGRPLWLSRGLPTDCAPAKLRPADPPQPCFDPRGRAAWWQLHSPDEPRVLIDVRTPQEYTGELLAEPGYPAEVAQRPGHIPGARHVHWTDATTYEGCFRPPSELARIYARHGVGETRPVITYCRIGERSAHTWFVLHRLLGHPDVRNYDGSWTEWGSMTGMPIAVGPEPGALPEGLAQSCGLGLLSDG
ncbi:MAG: sulfurtransferase [Solirubrobacteraceae bacterium]